MAGSTLSNVIETNVPAVLGQVSLVRWPQIPPTAK